MERPSLKYKKHRFVYYVQEKSQRACDLLLKKKFFILRPFLKTGIRSMLCFTSI